MDRQCEHCQQPFESRSLTGGEAQRFCSKYCKDEAWRQANLDEVRVKDRQRKQRIRAEGVDPKHRVRQAVNDALRSGALTRGPCEVGVGCRGRVEGHHDDYGRPLEVRWLCSRHHGIEHRRLHVTNVAA